jgi:putative sigma-54 modulation protein
MDVMINGTNLQVVDKMADYARERLEKLTRYLPNIASIRADFSQQHNSRGRDDIIVQITVRHSRGAILRSEEKVPMSDNNNAAMLALDSAIDKMYTRISRFKGKRKEKHMRDRFMATTAEIEESEAIPSIEDMAIPDAGWKEPQIIRRKQVVITAMNEEEAIEQMELLGHTFFMFFNADSNQIQVVYRRNNGGYGVLIPNIE